MAKVGIENFSGNMQQLIFHQYSNTASEAVTFDPQSKQEDGSCNEEYPLYQQLSRLHSVCKVSALIPTNACLIPSVIGQLSTSLTIDCQSYLVKDVTLDMLASFTFSQCFTVKGEVQALSAGTRVDVDDCAMLSPSGRLSLLVSANSYQQLGLVGQQGTNILRTPKHRYAVHVNTLVPSFHPHRPAYDRTLARLRTLKMDFNISWRPNNDVAACPSSIARYFVDLGLDVEQVEPSLQKGWTLKDVQIPAEKWINEEVCRNTDDLLKTCKQSNEEEEQNDIRAPVDCVQDSADFLEAIGCFLLKIIPTTFEGEQESVERLHMMQCNAYYTSTQLKHALQQARQWLLSSEGADAPWCCLCFHAHPEVPFENVHDGCAKSKKGFRKEHVEEIEQPTSNLLVTATDAPDPDTAESKKCSCSILQCGCGMVEADQHVVNGRMFVVIVRRKDFICYSYGSAGMRHRYYSKSSNNK